jgi:uracil phosphoribosyltransferase
MHLTILDHPLVTHKITYLRDQNTSSSMFRLLTEELVTLLAYEATRDIAMEDVVVNTPLTTTTGSRIAKPRPLIVPILRAGLGMLEGMTKLLPSAEVGFLGIKRNEETLEPFTYAERLPEELNNRQVFIIDPMLATGGTLNDSIDYVFERGAKDVTAICLLGAPEGAENVKRHLENKWPNKTVNVYLAAMDEKLNDIGYIVPGLGDAGDRLYGSAE